MLGEEDGMGDTQDLRRWWRGAALARWLGVALVGALILSGQAPAADKEPRSLFAAARDALAKGNVEKTKMLGFKVDTPFNDAPAEGAVLVGFEIGLGTWGNDDIICSLRPIYLTERGDVFGKEFGPTPNTSRTNRKPAQKKVLKRVTLKAEPGYAVGSVTLRSGLNMDGLSLTYLRIKGQGLDPEKSYTSEWIGRTKGGGVATMGGNGAPILGIFGTAEDNQIRSLGLVYLNQPSPAPTPPPERPRVEQPAEVPVIAPLPPPLPRDPKPDASPVVRPAKPAEEPPPVVEPDDPKPPERDTYHDPEFRYNVVVPTGWRRMPPAEMKTIHEFLDARMPGKAIRYDTGFRRSSARAFAYPYVLVQVMPLDPATVTYDDIERNMSRELNVAIKEAKGAFSDLFRDASLGSATLDRSRNRIVMRLKLDAGGFGTIQGVTIGHFGAKHFVALHCYARDDEFQQYLPIFTMMGDSFYFDEGYTFTPGAAGAAEAGTGLASWLPWVVFGLVAIPLALGSCLFFVLRGHSSKVHLGTLGMRHPPNMDARHGDDSEEILDVIPVLDALPVDDEEGEGAPAPERVKGSEQIVKHPKRKDTP
jgi:hypothetical protein